MPGPVSGLLQQRPNEHKDLTTGPWRSMTGNDWTRQYSASKSLQTTQPHIECHILSMLDNIYILLSN